MENSLFLLVIANFLAIGLLPVVFFSRERDLNIRWWLTAAPFFVAPLAVGASFLGQLQVWTQPSLVAAFISLGGTVAAIASTALITYTLGSHARPIALWHQNNDAPDEIVTWGAYRFIRHPFYTAFLLAFAAALLAASSFITLGCLVWAAVALTFTAKREERRLLSSRLGEDYGAYQHKTGRFVPRIG